MSKLNGYSLSRQWFDFAFENPEKIRPIHTAIYMFAVEHWNRLGQKKKFGFPSQMTMDAIGVKSYNTFIPAFRDLIEWGFFDLIEKSQNQYSANIIALSKYDKPLDKSLDEATAKAPDKAPDESSAVYINQRTKELKNQENVGTSKPKSDFPSTCEFLPEAEELATLLLDSICNWDATHKYHQKQKPPNSWILDIERAIRLDNRTPKQLEFIIRYVYQRNDDIAQFWAGNIESGNKLREQFDKVKNQIKNSKENVKHKQVQSTVDSLYGGQAN